MGTVPVWKRFWLLLTVIWVVVSGLNAATIIAFSPDEAEKAWRPIILGVAVPAIAYVIGWLWASWKAKQDK